MRKIIFMILSLCTVFSACQKFDDKDIWNSINSLDKRVETLEKLCREMNTNIGALQSLVKALENHDYITNVSPIHESGMVIGYTISFANGDPITIYHGQDGKDGQTPVVGVAKDTDGIYYWTVNGQWLLGENGQKIKAVGTDGQDCNSPELKIENGMWYVSYDDGATWIEVGQATGEQGSQGEAGPQGPQGNPGVGGDSMFLNVDYNSNSAYVIFVLSNGTEIKVPTWSAFEVLKLQCEQMNTNIEALSAIINALQNNDYVTSVTPVYEGGKQIGYTINFSKSDSVTIFHGKDGQTPVVGVAKDTDGIYYWTVNDQWLLGENGQKVKAVGTDGQDCISPELKIENGMWYVSYDDGATWIEVGQATGEHGSQGEAGPQGPQGNPGVDGDAFFQSVTQTNDYVLMVLANGTEIKIPKYSAEAATLTLDKVTGFTATFNGRVIRHSLDLKVTVYYSTTDNLTVYKHKGKASVTEFNGDTFTLRLTDLAANTTYYYFTEVVCGGAVTFSEISSFRTGAEDSYVDWGEGEDVGGDI